MAEDTLTETQLAELAREVDEQLQVLRDEPLICSDAQTRSLRKPGRPAATAQQQAIEKATGEKFETFWQRYLRHARKDLCLHGGVLHDQWKKYRDLESKTVVKFSYGVLAGMGISSLTVGPVAVAVSVFLITALAKIGIDTICEGCAEEEKARAKELKKSAEAESSAKKKPKAS